MNNTRMCNILTLTSVAFVCFLFVSCFVLWVLGFLLFILIAHFGT